MLKGSWKPEISIVADTVTEFIRFDPEVCICNGNELESSRQIGCRQLALSYTAKALEARKSLKIIRVQLDVGNSLPELLLK